MTPRWIWIAIGLLLAVIVAAIFVYPHQMVSPGNLQPAHAELQQNCFACHAPFRGASPDRCIACHTVADIGRLTTLGVPVTPASGRPAFHASLASQDCMACHTDHPRPRLTRNLVRSFDHALLTPAVQPRCAACHTPPKDNFHRGVVPTCSQCHSTTVWKPATFDHDRYFSLRPPHDATCSTCHVGGNVQAYTCFGCHEHQKARIEARHTREGIRNIANCVRCHRSAEGEGGEGQGREGREGRD
jgi:hypothetical protein